MVKGVLLPQLLLLGILRCWSRADELIVLDDTEGLGRTFDGIGGISGGSATSKLLADYKDPYRSNILDYLFKPQFGASLQILKVEIGGDAQASDATEASHMHNASDENYHRGYEWWLMKEAKSRNPDIKLYGLPWDFPAWIGNGTLDPYNDPRRLATYIVKWVKGAKQVHDLDIDYIGIWNERPYNIVYIKTLRQILDESGFEKTRIVAPDGGSWDIVNDMSQDAELESVVDILGVHYPGTESTESAVTLGKPLWSSEDYSTVNDAVGAGCWARLLNRNYVNGMMTSTIAWNLIDSYWEGLPWDRDSLMTAREPWSGYYIVNTPIWVSAHTCQFSSPGWYYLRHGYGVGKLDNGGSIVSMVSPDHSQLTIVVETLSHDHSKCIRPPLPAYNVTKQNITLQLMGSFVDIQELQVWYTKIDPTGHEEIIYTKRSPAKVVSGQVHLVLDVDEIYTLTTLTTGQKGDHGPPPTPAPFTSNYFDFFDDVHIRTEAIMVPVNGSGGVYLAARINETGCDTYKARGLFFFLFPNDQLFLLTKDVAASQVIQGGRNDKAINKVDNTMELYVSSGHVSGVVNKVPLFNLSIPYDTPAQGFVGLGTDSYSYADWDYIALNLESDSVGDQGKSLYFESEHH